MEFLVILHIKTITKETVLNFRKKTTTYKKYKKRCPENSPVKNSLVEDSPLSNSPAENSPVSFSQIIFDEKMLLFIKIWFFFYQED